MTLISDKKKVLFGIPVKWYFEEDYYIVQNEEYLISGYGRTKKEALEMFSVCVHEALIFKPKK